MKIPLTEYFCEDSLIELKNEFEEKIFDEEKFCFHLTQCKKCAIGIQQLVQDIVTIQTSKLAQNGIKGKVEAFALTQTITGLMKGVSNGQRNTKSE